MSSSLLLAACGLTPERSGLVALSLCIAASTGGPLSTSRLDQVSGVVNHLQGRVSRRLI